MSFVEFATMILGVSLTGAVFDRVISRDNLHAWRHKALLFWAKETSGMGRATEANALFITFFHTIYGKRILSKKRVIASVLTTLFSMFVISFVVGIEGSVWDFPFLRNRETGIWVPVAMAVTFVSINIFADYVSIAETRWVIRSSKNKELPIVLVLLFIDIVLTTYIFIVFAYLVMSFILTPLMLTAVIVDRGIEHFGSASEISQIYYQTILAGLKENLIIITMPVYDWDTFYVYITRKDHFQIFFLTTFVTSLLWFGFVLTYLFVHVTQRMLPVARYVVYQVAMRHNPGVFAATCINAAIAIAFIGNLLSGSA